MSYSSRARTAVSRTQHATRLTLRRRDGRLVFAGVTAAYLLVYLYILGHLTPGSGTYDLFVVSDPVSKFFQPALGPFSFEPVALVNAGPVTYLFSLNSVIGVVVAGLVGLNLALTYLVWVQPDACGIGGKSSGLLASVPALLSGTACCGPIVLILFGIQASAALVTGFQFLLPAAVLVLVGSLVLVGRQVRPDAI